MRIMLWANYRQGSNISVPSPFDGDKATPWFYDQIATQAETWANWAKTDILFPSAHKTNAGPYPGADGYGVYDDYDIGSKNTPQFGGIPTRFGYADQLRRAVAIVHANGMNALADYVMHQRMGGKAGVYRYGASGGPQAGRFPKDPGCFRGAPPRVPQDPVPAPLDDFSFGDELCPINAVPKGYVADGLIAGADWLFRTCGFDGARIDDTKGLAVPFLLQFLASPGMQGKWFFGEFASGGTWSWPGGEGLENWLQSINHGMSATDFDFHYNMVMPMCNDGGAFNMANLAGRGLIAVDPYHAVPFVESLDSDTNGFATVAFNKVQGYALLLTSEGLPQIYYRDWSSQPNCYGLHERIDNLCWIAHHFGNGGTIPRVQERHIYAYERTGHPGLFVTLNNDVFNPNWYAISCPTAFGPNVRLHDYSGNNAQDCWTDSRGVVTTGVPPAANGLGYGCWAPAGWQNKPVNKGQPRYTIQDFDGADDLDLPVLTPNKVTSIGRVWCEEGKSISLAMRNTNGQPADFPVEMVIHNPDGTQLVHGKSAHVYGDTQHRGWHAFTAEGLNLPVNARVPYSLRVTYMGTLDLHSSEFGM